MKRQSRAALQRPGWVAYDSRGPGRYSFFGGLVFTPSGG